jgi:hypothetical protein
MSAKNNQNFDEICTFPSNITNNKNNDCLLSAQPTTINNIIVDNESSSKRQKLDTLLTTTYVSKVINVDWWSDVDISSLTQLAVKHQRVVNGSISINWAIIGSILSKPWNVCKHKYVQIMTEAEQSNNMIPHSTNVSPKCVQHNGMLNTEPMVTALCVSDQSDDALLSSSSSNSRRRSDDDVIEEEVTGTLPPVIIEAFELFNSLTEHQ